MPKIDLTATLKSVKKPKLADIEKTVNAPVLDGVVAKVDEMIAQKRSFDRSKTGFELARRSLEPLATNLRIETEEKGFFHQSVVLKGSQDNVTMSYNDQFKAIDLEEGAGIKHTIGDDAFNTLYERVKTFTVDSSKAEKLRKVLREAGHDPDEYVTAGACYQVKEDFRENRFKLRAKLSKTVNAFLDLVISKFQYEPRLGGVKWADEGKAVKKAS